MTLLRSALLGSCVAFSLWNGWGLQSKSQPLLADVAPTLVQLDRAICLQQWQQAIDITGGLIASPAVSTAYRQELLDFRRQLQTWRMNPAQPRSQASCDRALSLFIPPAEPDVPQPRPLNWSRALANLRSPRPIIELDEDFEPALIPPELTASSPDILLTLATPIDTTDGFNVVGERFDQSHQVYSFLARLGDSVSLDVEVTRAYADGGFPQLFLFDQTGRLLTPQAPQDPQESQDEDGFQTSIQDFVIPKTDVYFAVVSTQDMSPTLNGEGLIVDWEPASGRSFDYTLTLTGVTPYQALIP
ncbi:MAG: hypothetical protein AAF282_21530 [Cyanobacteria bacterium P01_A01_bin.15]